MFGEIGAMLATLALLIFTFFATPASWLTLTALVLLLVMHGGVRDGDAPGEQGWLKDQNLKGAGEAFFEVGGTDGHGNDMAWEALRDRWGYAPVARAVLALLSLIVLATAVGL